MTMFIIQSALLILIAFLLGCVVGCLLYRWFGKAEETPKPVAKSAPPVLPAAAVAQSEPAPAPAPKPAAAPKPTAKKPAVKKAPIKKPATRKAPAKKPAPARKPKTVAASTKDDLKLIRGIGRQNEARLNKAGIKTFAEIASWTKTQQREIGEKLAFPGRIEREEWVKQAKTLAKGGETEFAKRVKKGDVDTSK